MLSPVGLIGLRIEKSKISRPLGSGPVGAVKLTDRVQRTANVSSELFAFGFDAYQLALLAPDSALPGNTRLSGLTADLILGDDGRVHRRFDWAEFIDGVPVKVWRD